MLKLVPALPLLMIVFRGVVGQMEKCSGFVTETSGFLTAPDSNNDTWYDNNAECMWIIEVSDSRSIRIQFLEMDIEEEMVCEYDQLKISDGLTPKVIHCGKELLPELITDTRLAVVEFKSDNSIRRKGFKIAYDLIEDPTCGYRTWRASGHFGSHDTNLTSGVCSWAIQGPRLYVALHVLVYNMTLTSSPGCEEEYVEIYDDAEHFGRFCNPEDQPVITTTENVLYVDLKSDAVNRDDFVFHVFYSTTDLNRVCGDITSAPSGTISSPDWSGNGFYDNFQNCVWTLVAPVGHVIRLKFLDFDLEWDENCEFDYVQVFDGPFDPVTSPSRTFCGDKIPGTTWTTGTIMVVQFFADAYNPEPERGFNSTYKHYTVSEKLAMLEVTTPADSTTVANTTTAPTTTTTTTTTDWLTTQTFKMILVGGTTMTTQSATEWSEWGWP